ncbi:retrovirus-related pol polyprotein from transposon TNT 1-94, partial [Tanacetum coccineum]
LPNGKRAIGTKWVFKNKKDKRGIVVRNKARLVAQGYTQEEGIYYDEFFAHVAMIEAISFKDSQFPDKVYKVEKALYGLHQAPRAWKKVKQKDDGIFISQDKYVADILKKLDFSSIKTASTPIETNKALLKDKEAEDVDVHLYRSMIGSLMYLTTSRPDIMFTVASHPQKTNTPRNNNRHLLKRRLINVVPGMPKHTLSRNVNISQENQPKDQLGVFSAAKVLADAAKNVHTYTRRRRAVSTSSGGVSTASRLFSIAKESVSTARASMPVICGTVQ